MLPAASMCLRSSISAPLLNLYGKKLVLKRKEAFPVLDPVDRVQHRNASFCYDRLAPFRIMRATSAGACDCGTCPTPRSMISSEPAMPLSKSSAQEMGKRPSSVPQIIVVGE